MRVDWDPAKDEANQRKHGPGFRDAAELFTSGSEYLEIVDEHHSFDEDRFIAIGPIHRGVVLVVWTERDGDTVRIISARFATKRETRLFHRHLGNER